MNIFFTGCTHFDHANIIRLANRPFQDAEEMNEAMISRWNAVVAKSDIVYHLGDVGYFKNVKETNTTLSRLNGKKILIIGNHDGTATRWSREWVSLHSYLELEGQAKKIVLFHYPIEDWNGRFKGSIHLHAHTHGSEFKNPVDRVGPTGSNRFNVGVDACAFAPMSIDEILEAAP